MNISHWSIQYEINCSKACSSVSWNPSLYRQNCPMIAVGSDDHNNTVASGSKILFYEFNDQAREWQKIVDKSWPGINELVHDISFAPNVGRAYDLLGVATTKDVKIISLRIDNDKESTVSASASSVMSSNPHSKRCYNIRVLVSFEDHGSQVWRVSWNITGTILASSGDDGAVRLWKANCLDNWKNVGMLKADENTMRNLNNKINDPEKAETTFRNCN